MERAQPEAHHTLRLATRRDGTAEVRYKSDRSCGSCPLHYGSCSGAVDTTEEAFVPLELEQMGELIVRSSLEEPTPNRLCYRRVALHLGWSNGLERLRHRDGNRFIKEYSILTSHTTHRFCQDSLPSLFS